MWQSHVSSCLTLCHVLQLSIDKSSAAEGTCVSFFADAATPPRMLQKAVLLSLPAGACDLKGLSRTHAHSIGSIRRSATTHCSRPIDSQRRSRQMGDRSESRQSQMENGTERAALLRTSASGDSTTVDRETAEQRTKAPIDWFTTTRNFIFPALGGSLFGYDIGATSGAFLNLTSPDKSGTDWYQLTPFQSGLGVSSALFGALAGSAAALWVGDVLGRKRELLLASAMYCIAVALTSLAPNYPVLVAGRLTYGLGIGFAMHAAPAYLAETAPESVRGLLISLKEALIVVGILLGYLTSYLFVDEIGGWRSMYGLAAIPALALGIGMTILPDSPRWLLLAGADRQTVKNNLQRCLGSAGSDSILEERVEGIAKAGESLSQGPGLGRLLDSRYTKPLTVGLSLMLFQQITGQPSVLYYAANIFEEAGFGSARDATGISVFLGFFKLVLTGVAVLTVDSLGRRPLLLGGVTAMVASLLALASATLLFSGSISTWLSVIALLAYVGAYQLSFGPISWLMVGEVFPLAVRGPAAALASLTNFGSNFLVSLALPVIQKGWGPGYTYLLFAGVGVVSVAVIYSIVPETKGRTLEEIEAEWDLEKDN